MHCEASMTELHGALLFHGTTFSYLHISHVTVMQTSSFTLVSFSQVSLFTGLDYLTGLLNSPPSICQYNQVIMISLCYMRCGLVCSILDGKRQGLHAVQLNANSGKEVLHHSSTQFSSTVSLTDLTQKVIQL